MEDPDYDDEIDSFWMFKMPLLFIITVIILGVIGYHTYPRSDGINKFEMQCNHLGGIIAEAKVPEGYKALICVKRSDVIIERPL